MHCLLLFTIILMTQPNLKTLSICSSIMSKTFLYFGYGSNLLAKRIHINNPSAKRIGIGKIKGYQLDFNTYSERWRGATATIIENNGQEVWGSIWELDLKDMDSLDNQEGVRHNLYKPLTLEVSLPDGGKCLCRVYQQCEQVPPTADMELLPNNRRPSKIYLDTIQQGAEESQLPLSYIKYLKQIPHNGYEGPVDIPIG